MALKRILGLVSYQTACLWLHKLRRAMVGSGGGRLKGTIEVDKTYGGGEKAGKPGYGAFGKALIVIAAENEGCAIGCIRLCQVSDASGESLGLAVRQSVEAEREGLTDGWTGHQGLGKQGFRHTGICPSTCVVGDTGN